MTKAISRKMAVDCLLYRAEQAFQDHICCSICNEALKPGQVIQFDHIFADALGGPHEYMNLRPLHTDCHKKKSKADVQALAKIDRILGITGNGPKRSIPSRPMQSGKSNWPTGRKMQSRPFQKRIKT